MSNKLNPFEEQLKKSVENHSVPYDADQWNQMEHRLNSSAQGQSSLFNWGWSAVAMVVVGFGVLAFIGEESKPEPIQNVIVFMEMEQEPGTNQKEELSAVVEEVQKETPNELAEVDLFVSEIEPSMDSPNKQKSNSQEEEVTQFTEVSERDEVSSENVVIENQTETEDSFKLKIPTIHVSKTEICAGIAIQANLDSDEFDEVIWFLGDGSEINSKTINHVFLTGGDYQIKAYLSKEEVFTQSVSVHVKSKPIADFSIIDNVERDMIPVKYISVNEGGAATYSWNLGDRTILKGEGISHTYRKKGAYEVSLRATNVNGCSWTTYQTVEIEKDFNLLATNSFTPNGDGLNDTWYPLALTSNYYKYELQVYDRKGSLVFESNNPENTFNGKVNGQMVTSGTVFIWKAITTDPNGVQQEFGGNFIAYP